MLVVLVGCPACSDQLDRDRLAGTVHEAHARAAEARLLGELRDRGALPGAFEKVHRAQLGKLVDDVAKDLAHRAEDGRLDGWREAALGLTAALASLVHADADTQTLTRLEQRLQLIDSELAGGAPGSGPSASRR